MITEKNGNGSSQKMNRNKAPVQRANQSKQWKPEDLSPEGAVCARASASGWAWSVLGWGRWRSAGTRAAVGALRCAATLGPKCLVTFLLVCVVSKWSDGRAAVGSVCLHGTQLESESWCFIFQVDWLWGTNISSTLKKGSLYLTRVQVLLGRTNFSYV